MTAITKPSNPTLPRDDSNAMLGIFVVSFTLLLLVGICAQLVARPLRSWLPGAEAHKSLVGGVKASVYTFLSYLT